MSDEHRHADDGRPLDDIADDAADGSPERGDWFAKSFARGLEVIKAFSPDEPQPTLSDIARKTGMTRAAARRFLLTLVELGYVGTADRRFFLRPAVLELGFTYLSVLSLPQLAHPHLAALTEQIAERTSLAVLDGDEITYVSVVGSHRVFTNSIAVGTRGAAYLSSHGRVLLAGLPPAQLDAYLERLHLERRTAWTVPDKAALRRRIDEARAQGWALVEQELEEGVNSLAVPLHGPDGRVVASVNMASHAHRRSPAALRGEVLQAMQAAVAAIERDLALAGGGARTRQRL
ncbi:IclR family transcriptional regulator C-terminal domain-containing protein [Modestobacter sp. NPDC049651]|uniref:IclR family transcriptional regulator domain-containing protein n=1 Tax=unclassified Modestobacter TaxID=2643866 RepID=UPI00340F0037